MDNDEDQTIFQTKEDKKRLEEEVFGEVSEDNSEFDTTLNDQ